MARSRTITIIPVFARTGSFNTKINSFTGEYTEAVGYLNVTAVSGTSPTLDVVYEVTTDGGTTYYPHSTFSQKTSTGMQRVVFARPTGIDGRIKCTIGGTNPSFTFSVHIEGK